MISNSSNCSNVYATSNVKSAVEAYAEASNMMNDLAEVDGYKIRLITVDELTTNLGYELSGNATSTWYVKGTTTPSWVYSTTYWTMSPNANYASFVWNVESGGSAYSYNGGSNGVRPVINLLKTSISS